MYATDNGYHIGPHRMHPAKQCRFEENVDIPFIVRGPNVPRRHITDVATTHADIASTTLRIASAPLGGDFDGLATPLTGKDVHGATEAQQDHVTIEHWGFALNEGKAYDWYLILHYSNMYEAIRVPSDS
ncbi:hypothetical protein DL767_003437 [Monosporascus sp. MG133]|nr:hypothetical protein DL767_003437 [Monosporascus sp. MG133]